MSGDLNPAEERALAERFLRDGDESAFRALYRRHSPMLYRVACRLAPNAERAADIVQEVWIRAAERLSSFRWESSLGTWLVGIAINCSREEGRRSANTGQLNSDAAEPAASGASVGERLDLARALEKLANGYREVLLLHDVEGYTHEEIAQALNIEPATSRSQLARARAAMRELLEQRKERP